jgi:hypothetical protein
VEFLEALGAVAALQQEGLALGHLAEQLLQAPRLAGEHQRRHLTQGGLDTRQGLRVRIVGRDVLGGLGSPGRGRPAFGHFKALG